MLNGRGSGHEFRELHNLVEKNEFGSWQGICHLAVSRFSAVKQMITILDGGMGQELIARSAAQPTPLWATKVLSDEPELVRAVHDGFFAAGAMVATTNSYAIHHERLIAAGLDDLFEPFHRAACEIACASRDAAGGGRVAGAIGPVIGS